ncbi:MAG: peptidoglycan DD-metalloendopeptidase family protein [Muribaculaceae bacterium]|nr:peptidoglycan DD-metalloendopeptidase family protein [Muribaculaceae bacterium]
MRRLLHIIILCLLLPLSADAAKPKKAAPAKPKTSADVKNQRKKTEQEMKQTTKKITMTEAQIKERLGRINSLQQQISHSEAAAAQLQQRLDSIAQRTSLVQDSIKANEAELARLRQLYTSAVRSSRRNRREMNTLTFLFSADNFRQAYRRMRYLEQYSAWRKRKAEQISAVVSSLSAQKASLTDMANHTTSLRRQEEDEQRKLKASRDSVNSAVKSLEGQKQQLTSVLNEQKRTIKKLDDEIQRLIEKEIEEQRRREAEEARKRAAAEAKRKAEEAAKKAQNTGKPADQKKPGEATPAKPKEPDFKPEKQVSNPQTGEFASRKGSLPSPLSHTYVVARPFGVQPHKNHTNVEVNNPGVDLETALGATARAVHAGNVSAVFVQDGFGHVVLVRHGSYLTVYANVKTINVKKGDTVKAGDVIGTVAPSEFNPNRGMLHFEIRREREKLDPQQWLKR